MTTQADDIFLTAEEDRLRQAVQSASIPALMMTLLHMERDDGVLDGHVRPSAVPLAENLDGLTEEDRAAVRERAVCAAIAWRDGGAPLRLPGKTALDRATVFINGRDVPDSYADFLREELPFAGPNRPAWRAEEVSPEAASRFPVAIIGAGLSGLLAGVRLKKAGYPFVIFEKSGSVGGTWRDNAYPGCRVDTPNHIYSYSFAADHDWPGRFSDRNALLGYLEAIADRFGLTPHIRLDCEVEAADWNEKSARWVLGLKGGDSHTARALISAVGQLNRPKIPDIPGLGDFAGPGFHSARWDHSVDLADKRVAVIGTGASATQFVPEIADTVAHLSILQRSPPWLVPTPDYLHDMTADERWLMNHWPFYAEWYRMWLFRLDASDELLSHLYAEDTVDGQLQPNRRNAELRQLWTDYLREQTDGDEALFDNLLPDYPPGGKRPLRDNGSWVQTLKRDDVSLVRENIDRVAPEGIRLRSGALVKADVIVFGTGFEADRFFVPMKITGRANADLGQAMANPRAYRGTSVPGFPNFFAIYGPNTNTVVGAGIIFFAECTMRYVMGCLNHLVATGRSSMDVRPEPFEAYNAHIDARNARRVWGLPEVDSWYKNEAGRVTQNWPDTHHAFWTMTLRPEPDDYAYT